LGCPHCHRQANKHPLEDISRWIHQQYQFLGESSRHEIGSATSFQSASNVMRLLLDSSIHAKFSMRSIGILCRTIFVWTFQGQILNNCLGRDCAWQQTMR
jgi:hypothetical protein